MRRVFETMLGVVLGGLLVGGLAVAQDGDPVSVERFECTTFIVLPSWPANGLATAVGTDTGAAFRAKPTYTTRLPEGWRPVGGGAVTGVSQFKMYSTEDEAELARGPGRTVTATGAGTVIACREAPAL